MNTYNPTRTHLLERFGSLKEMVRGQGHWLFDAAGARYLDFLSQYGVVSLGHNHPELVAAMQECLAAGQPSMVQPFTAPAAQALAETLKRITPGQLSYTVFANSGAEAAEAAIKLARARTGRLTILSTFGGFHGKTLGALSATGNPAYQAPFGAPCPGFEYVPFGDLDALKARLGRDDEPVAAFIVEPVQGEGGMVPAPAGYLAAAVELCRAAGTLTVFDEVQTGLGRTGRLFAAEEAGTAPDIMLLGKALGGGLMPIGACIGSSDAWDHDFGLLHSSTFAGNQLACTVALKVIELLLRDDQALVSKAADSGRYLMRRLTDLAERYPALIKEVRGRGLMAGIEFRRFAGAESGTMGFASRNGLITAVFSGHLLNTNRLVTAPVFNNAHFLRLEPPFTVGPAEIDQAVDAVDALCRTLQRKDYARVLCYLTNVGRIQPPDGLYASSPMDGARIGPAASTDGRGSFAFLVHYTTEGDYLRTDPSLRSFTGEQLRRWRQWTTDIGPGILDHVRGIRSRDGAGADGWLLMLPMLPRQLLELPPRALGEMFARIVALARSRGARVLGLGGFTSVVTRGGRRVAGRGIAVTTGNCLTSIMAAEGIASAAAGRGLDLADLHVAVIGATGAIGRLSSLLLAERLAAVTLVGNAMNPDAERRCRIVAGDVYSHLLGRSGRREAGRMTRIVAEVMRDGSGLQGDDKAGRAERAFARAGLEPPLRCTCHVASGLEDADVVLVATSSDQALIRAEHLKRGAIVCDVTRPSNVAGDLPDRRPDVMVFDGGLVEFPEPLRFGPDLAGSPPGVALGCLAETALLAMEGEYRDHSIGRCLDVAEADHIRRLAEKHGLRVASPEQCRRQTRCTQSVDDASPC